jgi:hypothetical protein
MSKTQKSKYYWGEDTVDHFRFISSYLNQSEVLQEITDFVELDCTIEDGEDEKDLVEDLFNLINSENATETR